MFSDSVGAPNHWLLMPTLDKVQTNANHACGKSHSEACYTEPIAVFKPTLTETETAPAVGCAICDASARWYVHSHAHVCAMTCAGEEAVQSGRNERTSAC